MKSTTADASVTKSITKLIKDLEKGKVSDTHGNTLNATLLRYISMRKLNNQNSVGKVKKTKMKFKGILEKE